MKKFAICYNEDISKSLEVVSNLETALKFRGASVEILEGRKLRDGFDFVFVVGGDGTLLNVARYYALYSTPVFGVNIGRLGFLSQSKESEISTSVDLIMDGKFKVEDRIMLESVDMIALNDFVIKGASTSRTSRFYLRINDKFVCDYLADGLIVSTPTGSTAYGLSAGGPVLAPHLEAFAIVPICPHTLTARPLVIPSGEKITISTCDNSAQYIVAADGQMISTFKSSIDIVKSKYCAKLALLENDEFYAVLRDKLHWGVSPKS